MFEDIMDSLHSLARKIIGRNESPSMGIIDSRSVKSSRHADPSYKGAPKVIEKLDYKFPRLTKILADGGYHGTLGDWVSEKFGWTVEVVLRPHECPTKFPVLPKR